MGRIDLTGRGRKRVLRGHPWIYADDVAGGEGEPGELVPVHAPDGGVLGWGLFSSHSRIAVRLVTRTPTQPDRAFWSSRVRQALAARGAEGLVEPAGACRLIAGDADGLPGLVVDRYADVLVMQSGCQGSDRMLPFLQELVEEALPFDVAAVLDRSDASVRKHEALDPRVEWRKGSRTEPIEVVEEVPTAPRLVYEVDVLEGHKTGHYLDQRENRLRAARHADGARVLDVFSYDGLFGIRAALAGAASVLCIDQAAGSGERCLRNAERNGVADRVRFEKAKAMEDLRRRVEAHETYDLVVTDPPAFARRKAEAEGAVRGYRELARCGLTLTEPGGLLVTASCSYNIDRRTFVRCLAEASVDAGREARIVRSTGAGPDHPVLATVPETDYLKCLFVRVGS
jgi:23S rRNA (cytosine1962-C5)-methyltransferase